MREKRVDRPGVPPPPPHLSPPPPRSPPPAHSPLRRRHPTRAQSCHADRRSQLPGQGALGPRHLERPLEHLLGGARRAVLARKQQQFALDAPELGDIPPLVPRLASRERLVGGREPLRYLAGLSETYREFAAGKQKPRQVPRPAREFERLAQQRQSGREVAPARDQEAPEGARPQIPQADRMTLGVF